MQFATNCTWGTDSQFISHQTLHRPDSLTATTTRPVPPRKPSRPVINPATGKQVCYDFQRHDGCRFGSSCKYDHVCIKPQCLGTHPLAAPVCCHSRPPIANPHSSAEISPNCTLTEDLAGDISSTSLHAGNKPHFTTHHPAECGESLPIEAGPLSESMQQPKAAKVSTDLIFETWATEL